MAPILEGRLESIGWVSRNFILSDNSLEFTGKAAGVIDLVHVDDVSYLSSGSGREISIRTPGRNYLLR